VSSNKQFLELGTHALYLPEGEPPVYKILNRRVYTRIFGCYYRSRTASVAELAAIVGMLNHKHVENLCRFQH
jgi:hypothetical protein